MQGRRTVTRSNSSYSYENGSFESNGISSPDIRRFSVSSLSGIDDAAKIDRIVRSLKSILAQCIGGSSSSSNDDEGQRGGGGSGGAGSPAMEIDTKAGFREIGMDSLMLLQFHNQIQEVFQAELNATALFDYPTIDELAGYLLYYVLDWGSQSPVPRRKSMVLEECDENAIAIVGMSCEVGGAHSPTEYWQLLLDGVEAICEIPPGRMDYERYYNPRSDIGSNGSSSTMMYTNRGGFIPNDVVKGFDCSFFEVSPVEARIMDPQHRLLMRLAWEALEDAGIPAASLRGSKTGVYMGVSTNDYSDVLRLGRNTVGTFCTTSNLLSMASGRISYMLGLQGPSFSVDTACSSSLVAIHLACQGLRLGECEMAIVGGVQLLMSPRTYVNYCKAKLLARDGRCRAFDDAASGFVRGEGAGLVVLKRLTDAIDARDNVLAVIKGSAVNQDGRGMGLTVPNGFAQASAIRRALRNANMEPEEIGMVETHGTGTSLGDPIEMNALESIFGDAGRMTGQPLYVGAGKANVGHLEAAAGIVALIKVVQCLRHGVIPGHPNLKNINHLIANTEFFTIPVKTTVWQSGGGGGGGGDGVPRAAGISGFGVSGTNAHIIVQEATPALMLHGQHDMEKGAGVEPSACGPSLITISAKGPEALKILVENYKTRLEQATASESLFKDIAYTSNVGRTHFEHRIAIVGSNAQEALAKLARDDVITRSAAVANAEAAGEDALLAFVFRGTGGYFRMGQEVYEPRLHRLYVEKMNACGEVVEELLGTSLTTILYEKSNCMTDPVYADLACFATEYCMAQLLLHVGVQPRYVTGTGLGEYIAAAVAGVLSLRDALRLVCKRAQLMQKTTKNDVRAEFQRVADSMSFTPPKIPMVSCMAGVGLVKPHTTLDAGHWVKHLSTTTNVQDNNNPRGGMDALHALKCVLFVDLGPNPASARDSVTAAAAVVGQEWIPCLCPGKPALDTFINAVARLYCSGIPINFRALHECTQDYRHRVELPHYPFDNSQHCWPPRFAVPEEYFASTIHSLLGRLVCDTAGMTVYENHVSPSESGLEYLGAHMFKGDAIFPASAYVELAVAAGRELCATTTASSVVVLQDFEFEIPLVFDPQQRRTKMQSLVKTASLSTRGPLTNSYTFEVVSQSGGGGGSGSGSGSGRWNTHCKATLSTGSVTSQQYAPPPPANFVDLCARLEYKSAADFYTRYERSSGIRFGPEFKKQINIWAGPSDVVGEVDAGMDLDLSGGYLLHPALLDSAFQTLFSLPIAAEAYKSDFMVVSIGQMQVYTEEFKVTPSTYWVHVRLQPTPAGAKDTIIGDLDICTVEGVCMARVNSFRVAKVQSQVLNAYSNKTTELAPVENHVPIAASPQAPAKEPVLPLPDIFYHEEWQLAPAASPSGTSSLSSGTAAPWIIITDADAASKNLATALQQKLGTLAPGMNIKLHTLSEKLSEIDTTLQKFLTTELRPQMRISGLVYIAAAGAETAAGVNSGTHAQPPVDYLRRICHSFLLCTQQLVKLDVVIEQKCIVVTQGGSTRSSTSNSNRLNPFGATLWGMVKSIRREHPELKMGVVDIDICDSDSQKNATTNASAQATEQLVDELSSQDGEYQVVYESGARYVPRLKKRAAPPSPQKPSPELRTDRSYIVTGGLGGLGLELVKWLHSHGASHITVLSRSGSTTGVAAPGLPPCVQVVQCDVSDEQQLRTALQRITPSIAGCFHVAGVYADAGLLNQSWEVLLTSFRPKVLGAWNLHKCLPHDLELFVMYSSYASIRGSRGQVNYAGANAFLDALAHYRAKQGQAALSVNWGAWGGVGQATKVKMPPGLAHFEPDVGMRSLGAVLAAGTEAVGPQICISEFNWPEYFASENAYDPWFEFIPGFNMKKPEVSPIPMLLESAAKATSNARPGLPPLTNGNPSAAFVSSGGKSLAQIKTIVREAVTFVTGFTQLSDKKVFSQLGLDSIMTIDLRNRIQDVMKFSIPMTTLFDNQTIEALAKALHKTVSQNAPPIVVPEIVLPPEPEEPAPAQVQIPEVKGDKAPLKPEAKAELPATPSEPIADQDIAIVGMSYRLGSLATPEDFWRVLSTGGDNMVPIPPLRFNIDDWYDPNPAHLGRIYTRVGGFCSDVDCFDNDFFQINRQEAELLDPQQRFLLEGTWEALERAGIPPHRLNGSKTAVFIGVNTFEYNELLEEAKLTQLGDSKIPILCFTGNTASSGAGRISFLLGLQGPCVAVDSACSSACVGLQMGAQALLAGDVNLAIVGGIGLTFSPNKYIHHCVARIIGTGDKCKTFDASADGFTRGEGFGIILLKRMADAVRDKDNVLAVIKAGAVSQGGFASGWIVPNGPGQVRLMREVIQKSKVDPKLIDYIELHGTGTQMGDAIELNAVEEVFREFKDAAAGGNENVGGKLRVGSAKGNVGHLEAACAMAGLAKLILAMRHRTIPPQPHFKTMNKNVTRPDFFVVPTQCEKWIPHPGQQELLAGISALGFSGTNAHLIVQSYHALEKRQAEEARLGLPAGPYLCTISAKTDEALGRLVQDYAKTLDMAKETSLFRFCYTSNIGRTHYPIRFATVATSIQELRSALSQFTTGFSEDGDKAKVFIFNDGPVAPLLSSSAANQAPNQLEAHPEFAKVIEQCSAVVADILPCTLDEILHGSSQYEDYAYVRQFVVQYASAQLWIKLGLAPDIVMGEGVGEYVAAVLAGVMDLDAALRVLSIRAITLAEAKGAAAAGDPAAGGRRVQAIYGRFKTSLALMRFNAPASGIKFVSGYLGREMQNFNAQYWADQLQQQQQHGPNKATNSGSLPLNALPSSDEAVLIYIGTGAKVDTARAQGYTCIRSSACVESAPNTTTVDWGTFLTGVAQAYNAGLNLEMDNLYGKTYFKSEHLPTYSFEKTRLWYK